MGYDYYHSMTELLDIFPHNMTILDAAIKTEDHIRTQALWGGAHHGLSFRRIGQ